MSTIYNELFKSLPAQTTADIDYYIDSTSGDDDNDGLASDDAFLTLAYAVALLPDTINHTVTLHLVDESLQYDPLILDGFKGNGTIVIDCGDTYFDIARITLTDCECNINISAVMYGREVS